MIRLEINQPYTAKQIFYLINQLCLFHYKIDNEDSMPFSISIKKYNSFLHISSNSLKELKIQLPCRADNLIDQLENISKTFYFTIYDIVYFPLDQILKKSDKLVKLNLIHNNILKLLSIKTEGIAKAEVYKIIWPKDKDYQVNKLDTHITNLKNIISKELDQSIIFESNNGILKINK